MENKQEADDTYAKESLTFRGIDLPLLTDPV